MGRLAARSSVATIMIVHTIVIKTKARIVSSIGDSLTVVGPVGRAFARIQSPRLKAAGRSPDH